MSSKDRRPHETATILNQTLLDYCQDNLDNKLQLIVEIERPQTEETRYIAEFTLGSPGIIYSKYCSFVENEEIIFESSGTLPGGLEKNKIYFVKNINNNSFEISETINASTLDILTAGSGTHKVSSNNGLIRVSDRNIFVGSRFYEARTIIPVVSRTIGEWLRPVIEFSSLEVILNNVDEFFSEMLPGGKNYEGQINKTVKIKLGLRDVESTYFTIFSGFVSETGGFKRDISSVKYLARDKFTNLDVKFPNVTFHRDNYPKISDKILGTIKPIIYGDYLNYTETEGNIPAIIVNSSDPKINKDKEYPVIVTNGNPGIFTFENHFFDENDRIKFTTDDVLPSPLDDTTDYYVLINNENSFSVSETPSGTPISTSGGSGQHNVICQEIVNVKCVISDNELTEFKNNEVYLVKSDAIYLIDVSDISNISLEKNYFEIIQNSGNTIIDGENYLYDDNDQFLVKVKGKNLDIGEVSYSDNIISQAQDILKTYANVPTSEFDDGWLSLKNKITPSYSAIFNIKSRIYIKEQVSVLEYVLSLLEQVRLELFISKDLKLKINSVHLEDFDHNPNHILRNFDIIEGSINVSIDEKNNFNRAQGFFDFNPFLSENNKTTSIFKNQSAIDQAGKNISKAIEFPNLYIRSQVNDQVKEILKISSGYSEIINCEVTSRQLLLDIGDFVKANISIDSTKYNNVPMMIREIGYTSELRLPIKLWSFQMIPFANPDGWNPDYNGIVGGDSAIIIEE